MAVPQDLYNAIKQNTTDPLLQQALLVGSYGESGWGASSNLFGFTSSVYGNAASESPSQQVAAILGPGTYQAAENALPAGLSGPAAAEWIALGGEAPAFSTPATISAYPTTVSGGTEYQLGYSYTPGVSIPSSGISEQEVIAQTGQATQYGANASFNQSTIGGVWSDIITAQQQAGVTLLSDPTKTTTPQIQPQNTPVPPQGFGQTNAQAVAIAKADLASSPSTQGGFANQTASALSQNLRAFTAKNTTDAHGNTVQNQGFFTDVGNWLGITNGKAVQFERESPIQVVKQSTADAASDLTSGWALDVWNVVKSGLVRLGIGILGILFVAAGLYIIVQKVSGGAMPIPIPI